MDRSKEATCTPQQPPLSSCLQRKVSPNEIDAARRFNIGADNVHSPAPSADLLANHGYADHLGRQPELRGLGAEATLFSSERLKSTLGWRAQHDWRDILRGEDTDAGERSPKLPKL